MSTCISRHGEFGEHRLDDSYTCTLCHVLDEEALRAELERLRAALAAVEQDRDILSGDLDRATVELECKTSALQKIRDRAHATGAASIVTLAETALRVEVWDGSVPPGGFVCAVCRTPVESEPCVEHSGTPNTD